MSPLEPETTTRMPRSLVPSRHGPAARVARRRRPPSGQVSGVERGAESEARDFGYGGIVGPVVATSGAVVGVIVGVLVVLFVVVIFLSSAIKVVTEYERSVFFRLGHVRPEAKGPGVIFRFPVVDRWSR